MAADQNFDDGTEPDLIELLADPLILALMRSDGVTLAELCAVIRSGRQRLDRADRPEPMPEPRARRAERWCGADASEVGTA